MKLEDLKEMYERKGDFKFAFQWYIPVSVKFAIADIAKRKGMSENQVVKEYLREGIGKEKIENAPEVKKEEAEKPPVEAPKS